MQLTVNGTKEHCSDEITTLADFLTVKEIESRWIAVAVNQKFIPKSQYQSHELRDNDDIELVTPHPGG